MVVSQNEIIDVTGTPLRSPEIVLAEAKRAAQALTTVIRGKAKPVMFNGEQYLEFEDWQTVSKFYGVNAKCVSSQFITCGDAKGFEAHAVAIDSRSGTILSEADSMCLNDEKNWSTRLNKKTNEQEPVPMFQLRSMAQTRACAKALRQIFGWVVVLAGYKATPAEEMPSGTVSTSSAAKPSTPRPVTGNRVSGIIETFIPCAAGKKSCYLEMGGSRYYAKASNTELCESMKTHLGQEVELTVEPSEYNGKINYWITELIPVVSAESAEATEAHAS
jgi:hypothetical protein